MNEQTLKIRIKLQTPQDVITDEPKSINDIFGESLHSAQQDTKRIPAAAKLSILIGFLFLIGAVCYWSLRSRDTTPAHYATIDTPIATLSGSDQRQRSSIDDTSAGSSPTQETWVTPSNPPEQHLQRPSEIEGSDQEALYMSDDSTGSKDTNHNEEDVKSTLPLTAKEEAPPPKSTTPMANSEPVSDQMDQTPASPTSEPQISPSMATTLDNEPSDNENANAQTPPFDSGATSSESPVSFNIVRAQLTNNVKNREPVDLIKGTVSAEGQSLKHLYYFTEFRNMQGQTLSHRWIHEGKTVAEVNFDIRGNRWRVYSSKYLTPSMAGHWQVLLVDARGEPLKTEHFSFIP